MALRENTGLQIALILFVMITVALAVSTYVYWDSANESQKKEAAAMASLSQKETDNLLQKDEIAALRTMMGYKPAGDGGPVIVTVQKNFNADMSLFGEGWESEKNYRTLPDFFSKEVVKVNNALAQALEDKTALAGELAKARQQETKNVAEYVDKHKQATDDLATRTGEFRTLREGTVATMDDIQVKLDKEGQQVAALKSQNEKEVEALTKKNAVIEQRLMTTIEKIKAVSPEGVTSQPPDGQITWVSQEGGTVYINLGSADALRRSTMFTVYEAGTTNISNAEPKASIEVTTVRGPHLSEARIVEDSLSNPILSRDTVFSPVWNPGQKTHFALLGFMDIDGDNKSDRALVRSLITQNGGEIDAEVLDDGTRKGRLTINTRYLVQGDRANDKSSVENLEASSQMLKEAGDLGIENISVERLLSDMGWRGSERTVSAGSGAAGGNFKATPKTADEPPTTGGAFEKRQRPGTVRRGSGY